MLCSIKSSRIQIFLITAGRIPTNFTLTMAIHHVKRQSATSECDPVCLEQICLMDPVLLKPTAPIVAILDGYHAFPSCIVGSASVRDQHVDEIFHSDHSFRRYIFARAGDDHAADERESAVLL